MNGGVEALAATFMATSVLVLAGTGCQSTAGLTPAEREQVQAGDRVVVLLRIQCTIDGQPWESFAEHGLVEEGIFAFGLGSFETVGVPVPAYPRSLTADSARDGWVYLLLAPGTYYIAVLGPMNDANYRVAAGDLASLLNSPRWRLEVPEGVAVVHPGTLLFEGRTTGTLMFGKPILAPNPDAAVVVRDDVDEAGVVAARHFPSVDSVPFVPLQRWRPGEPRVITTPHDVTRRRQ